MSLPVASAITEIVRFPNLNGVRLRLPVGPEGIHVGLILFHHQVRQFQLGLFETAQGTFLQKSKKIVCRGMIIQFLHDHVIRFWTHPVETDTHLIQPGFD